MVFRNHSSLTGAMSRFVEVIQAASVVYPGLPEVAGWRCIGA